MELSARLAEVRLQDPPLHLMGTLEAADHNSVRVAFGREIPREARHTGGRASLVIPTETVIYLAPATVAEAQPERLALNITGAIQAIQRRAIPRVPYHEAVSVRVLRTSGLAGAWFAGVAVDIGLGGAKVRCRQPLARGMMVEVRVPLPAPAVGTPGRQGTALAPQQFWLRAKGRVAHAHLDGDGCTVAGVQFLHLTAEEELRVLEVVEGSAGRNGAN
ncbi:MAG: PilZ domain-containing protein [Chthonomonadales bacterium]